MRLGILLLALLLPAGAAADGLDDILERRSVRIGVCEFVPWTFVNRAGELEGFEVDVARQIAFDLGVTLEMKVYPLGDVFPAVDRGEIDLIAAGLAITPRRALLVEFSSPYNSSGGTVVTSRSAAPGIARLDDLNRPGFNVLIVPATFSAELTPQLFDVAKVVPIADRAAAERELLAGRAHGFLTSLPEARIMVLRNPEALEMPLAEPIAGSVAGLAVRRGNQAVLHYLNAWIASRTADGWLAKTRDYWFSGYDWTRHMKE
jgi:polar amino acid transport system substrate-binding protein